MTRKLFWDDPYRTHLDTRIATPAETVLSKLRRLPVAQAGSERQREDVTSPMTPSERCPRWPSNSAKGIRACFAN